MMMMEEEREPRMKPRGPSGPRPSGPRPGLPSARPVGPRPGPMNAPGFGYYYPRSAYQMPAARPYGYPYGSYYY